MPKYTKTQIDDAITALDIYGSRVHGTHCPVPRTLAENIGGDEKARELASNAWIGVVTAYDPNTDALEAAQLLREGLIPVRNGWDIVWE